MSTEPYAQPTMNLRWRRKPKIEHGAPVYNPERIYEQEWIVQEGELFEHPTGKAIPEGCINVSPPRHFDDYWVFQIVIRTKREWRAIPEVT